MLTIKYDPNNGLAVPDGQAETFASDVVKFHTSSPRDETVSISTSAVVEAFRVMVCRGRISHEQIQFMYKDTVMPVDIYGGLKVWPNGFCSHTRDFVVEIMRTRSNAIERKT